MGVERQVSGTNATVKRRAVRIGIIITAISGACFLLNGTGANPLSVPVAVAVILWLLSIPFWVPGMGLVGATTWWLHMPLNPPSGSQWWIVDVVLTGLAFLFDAFLYSVLAYYYIRRRSRR